MTTQPPAQNSVFQQTDYVPGAADSSGYQIMVDNIVAVLFFICLVFAFYIRMLYPPKDYFVSKALYFLIISLVIRLVMATGHFVFDQKID